jgi:hypothetical protein
VIPGAGLYQISLNRLDFLCDRLSIADGEGVGGGASTRALPRISQTRYDPPAKSKSSEIRCFPLTSGEHAWQNSANMTYESCFVPTLHWNPQRWEGPLQCRLSYRLPSAAW